MDNYGACGNNMESMGEFTYSKHDNTDKLSKIAEYQFSLAFDNTEEEYNQSEKLWQSLLAGTIPIYWGAPVKHLLPCENCIIDVRDFQPNGPESHITGQGGPTADAITALVQKLNNDASQRDKYLEWRKTFDPADFVKVSPLILSTQLFGALLFGALTKRSQLQSSSD